MALLLSLPAGDAGPATFAGLPSAPSQPATQPSPRPATRPDVNRPPLWRLKPGAPTELQRVIDDQEKIRKDEWERLMRERNSAQAEINSVTRVARQDRNQRPLAQKIGDRERERYKALGVLIKDNESRRVPAYPYLSDFTIIPDFIRNGMSPPLGARARGPQRKYPGLGHGGVRAGHYPFTGATVVSIIDEHTAVLRPRALVLVDYELHDADKFYVWLEQIDAVREREPVLAIHLPTTKDWKPGEVVLMGEYWIVRGLPDNTDGTLPSPEISIEAFDPTLIERANPAAGAGDD